ncbi:hypothetical protein BDZ85DRAFT_297815 [Elsinoe ampelina]|uniref:AB hydrolase-1 domain-containing protein n=1 Tax=Elsinoe ampelina TaxID=302913 RepID=A0A6A6G632_9PEZI|nr:hypothetical protein BDZ85DRAFT_297815 [Elsinoe ampelina]
MDAEPPPIAMRPRAKQKKSANSVRHKPADTEVLTSMIDALSSFTPSPSTRKHYEVVDGYYDSPRASSRHSRLPSIEDDDGGAPSPVVGPTRSPSERKRPGVSRQNSGMTYGDLISAESPYGASFKRRSLQSVDSLSLREQGGGLRRLFRTTSMRSRSSLTIESTYSGDSDRSSRHSIATLQGITEPPRSTPRQTQPDRPAPRPPTSEPRPRRGKSTEMMFNTDFANELKPDTTKVRKDSYVEAESSKDAEEREWDIQIPRKPLPNGTLDRFDIPAPTGQDVSPGSGGAFDKQFETPPVRRKKKKSKSRSASSSTRSSPLKSPITDAIPERRSSLNQAEKTAAEMEKRALRKSKSASETGSARRRKKAARTEKILEELGEDDETVRRIRELKLQKEERMRQEKTHPNNNAVDQDQNAGSDGIKVGTGSHQAENGVDAARAMQEPSEPPPEPTKSISNINTTRLADTTKAHKLLGLTTTTTSLQNTTSPLASNPPARRAPQRPTSSGPPGRTSVDSRTTDVDPEYNYATAMKTLEKQSRPSIDTRRSQDKTLPKQNGVRPSLDKRRPPAIVTSLDEGPRASIDEEIDSFLTNPRLNRTVRHPKTNRLISFSEVGAPTGFPVVVCVGMGLTRFVSAFYDELATTLNLRLITPDRPGVGRSEPYSERDAPGPMSWHQDVAAICTSLNITHFSLLAHSAGSIFAMATALVLPNQVTGKVFLLAPWIPPSQFDTPSPEPTTASLPRSQRLLRVLPVSLLKAANSSFLGLNTNSMTSTPTPSSPGPAPSKKSLSPTRSKRRQSTLDLSPTALLESELPLPSLLPFSPPIIPPSHPDHHSPVTKMSATSGPLDPELAYSTTHLHAAQAHHDRRKAHLDAALLHRVWAEATRDSNPANDLLVCLERNRGVGFRYTDVRKRVVVVHGEEDKRVRSENVRWLVAGMNRAREARGAAAAAASANGGAGEKARGDGLDGDDDEGLCELRLLRGEGHGLMAVASVMGDVLSEIAEEWRVRARRERDEGEKWREERGVVELGTERGEGRGLFQELEGR